MKSSSLLIKKALYFSAQMHDGQYRKGGRVPYISHPVLVSYIVNNHTDEEEISAAALLHDILEDCPDVSFEYLQKEFGAKIANLVREVSFLEQDASAMSWKEKKVQYLERLKSVSSDALVIIAADKMTNMQGYFDALIGNSPAVKEFFKGTPEQYFWYYEEIGKILLANLHKDTLVKEYMILFNGYKKTVRNASVTD